MIKRTHSYRVPRALFETTCVLYDEKAYRASIHADRVAVVGGSIPCEIGSLCRTAGDEVEVKVTPGSQNFLESLSDVDLRKVAAACLLTGIVGHPNAEDDRVGTRLSAVWSHHFALAHGEDPRRIAKTYAPTETKTIAWRVQHAAALGVEVLDCGSS